MAVAPRQLAGHEQLHAGVKALRDLREAADARVLEHGDPPFGLLGGDEPAGLEQKRADVAVEAPQRRHARGSGSGGTRRLSTSQSGARFFWSIRA